MNPNTNDTNPNYSFNYPSAPGPVTAADIPLALKARYFGTGLVVGVFVSEPLKKMLAKLTSQVEGLAEKAGMGDVLAQAKEALGTKKDECCDDGKEDSCHGNA